jgi:hypothetical protein
VGREALLSKIHFLVVLSMETREHLYPFEERKGQRPLRSKQLKLKEEEDLCKECTRPTLG